MGIRYSEIKNKKTRALIDAEIARSGYSEPKRNRRRALVGKASFAQGMVDIDCALIVNIVRVHTGQEYDDDNLSGGCKQLRDAIAAALSRKGDSWKNGLRWEYHQEIGEIPEIRIEIYKAGRTSEHGRDAAMLVYGK